MMMKSFKDKALWVSKPIIQEPSDNDWVKVEPIIEQKFESLNIAQDKTTETKLVINDYVSKGDEILFETVDKKLFNVRVESDVDEIGKITVSTNFQDPSHISFYLSSLQKIIITKNYIFKVYDGNIINVFDRKSLKLKKRFIFQSSMFEFISIYQIYKINDDIILLESFVRDKDNKDYNILIKMDIYGNIIEATKIYNSYLRKKIKDYLFFVCNGNVLVKTTLDLKVIWKKQITYNTYIGIRDITSDSDGNIIVLASDNIVLKLNKDGELIWARKYIVTDDYYKGRLDTFSEINIDLDNNIILNPIYPWGGFSQIMKLDQFGGIVWSKVFKDRSMPRQSVVLDGNDIYVSANGLNNSASLYLYKITPDGAVKSALTIEPNFVPFSDPQCDYQCSTSYIYLDKEFNSLILHDLARITTNFDNIGYNSIKLKYNQVLTIKPYNPTEIQNVSYDYTNESITVKSSSDEFITEKIPNDYIKIIKGGYTYTYKNGGYIIYHNSRKFPPESFGGYANKYYVINNKYKAVVSYLYGICEIKRYIYVMDFNDNPQMFLLSDGLGSEILTYDSDNNIYFLSKYSISKVNSDGSVLWEKSIDKKLNSVDSDSSGNTIVSTIDDGIVVLFDSNGNIKWSKKIGDGLTFAIFGDENRIYSASKNKNGIVLTILNKNDGSLLKGKKINIDCSNECKSIYIKKHNNTIIFLFSFPGKTHIIKTDFNLNILSSKLINNWVGLFIETENDRLIVGSYYRYFEMPLELDNIVIYEPYEQTTYEIKDFELNILDYSSISDINISVKNIDVQNKNFKTNIFPFYIRGEDIYYTDLTADIDLSKFNLKSKPNSAWRNDKLSKIYIGLEGNEKRLIWKDEDITDKVSGVIQNGFILNDVSLSETITKGDTLFYNGEVVKVEGISKDSEYIKIFKHSNYHTLSVKTDNNGNILVSGKINENNTWNSVISKLNYNGDVIWQKKITENIISTFEVDSKNNIIIGTDSGNLIKLNEKGNILWQKKIGKKVISLVTDKESNIFVLTEDGYLIKLSQSSDILFVKKFESNVILKKISTDSQGNIYITGYVNNSNSEKRNFLIKTNSKGEIIWQRYYKIENLQYFDNIVVDSNNNIILSGVIETDKNIVLLKLSKDGIPIWKKKINTSSKDISEYSLDVDSNNNILLVGTLNSTNGLILKLNSAGSTRIQKKFEDSQGNNIRLTSITYSIDGSVLIGGNLIGSTTEGVLLKLFSEKGTVKFDERFTINDTQVKIENIAVDTLESSISLTEANLNISNSSINSTDINLNTEKYIKYIVKVRIDKLIVSDEITSVIIPDRTIPLTPVDISVSDRDKNLFQIKYNEIKNRKGRALLIKLVSDKEGQEVSQVFLNLYKAS